MFGWVNRDILYNLLAMGMLYQLGHFRQWRVWFQDTIIIESCECHWPSNLIFHFHKHLCQFILHWGSLNWGNESEYVRQGWPLFGCVSYTEVNVMCKMMQITALTATSLYFPPLWRLLFRSPSVPRCFEHLDVFAIFDEKCPSAFLGKHLIH